MSLRLVKNGYTGQGGLQLLTLPALGLQAQTTTHNLEILLQSSANVFPSGSLHPYPKRKAAQTRASPPEGVH